MWNSWPFFSIDPVRRPPRELLEAMSDCGPDRARLAIYGTNIQGGVQVTVFAATGVAAFDELAARMMRELEV